MSLLLDLVLADLAMRLGLDLGLDLEPGREIKMKALKSVLFSRSGLLQCSDQRLLHGSHHLYLDIGACSFY